MKKSSLLFISFLCCFFTIFGQGKSVKPHFRKPKMDSVQVGMASYYSDRFEGRKTSSGEKFSQKGMTCAHNSLPLGSWVKISNIKNDKFVLVRVTDRMHWRNKRLVDLSKAAAKELGFGSLGLMKVKLEVLGSKPEEID